MEINKLVRLLMVVTSIIKNILKRCVCIYMKNEIINGGERESSGGGWVGCQSTVQQVLVAFTSILAMD